MSKDPTQKLPDGPSFEERMFARFDAIDARLQRMEERQERMESRLDALETQAERRALETKPIWEQALAEILEVKEKVADLDRKLDIFNRRHNAGARRPTTIGP